MPYPVKGLLEVYEDMVEILLVLQVFLAEDPEIEYLFCGAPSSSETESTAYLKFTKLQHVSSGFRCRLITGSLMRLY